MLELRIANESFCVGNYELEIKGELRTEELRVANLGITNGSFYVGNYELEINFLIKHSSFAILK